MYQFKGKDSELIYYPVYLGDISKVFSVNNMNQTWLHEYMHDTSIHSGGIDVDGILDIHKYLINKINIK